MLALCRAAPSLEDVSIAERLLNQLCPYFLKAHTQIIALSPFLKSFEPSPWELLSASLTNAILAVGLKHPTLHQQVFECIRQYLHNCLEVAGATPTTTASNGIEDLVKTIGIDRIVDTAVLSTSLLGFLDAASKLTHFFGSSEKLYLVTSLREIFNESFVVAVEGIFSSLRTSIIPSKRLHNWRYFSRRYAACGRPLGAMLLQQGFLKLLVSCSSLEVSDQKQLQHSDNFDILLSQQQSIDVKRNRSSTALLELLSEIALEEMQLLEDGADYLQLASVWQQRLAFSVKAHTLSTYLNCMIANEEVAEVDVLVPWLEETIADPVQMADERLAAVVLRAMAIISKFSLSFATSFSHILPRFIIQTTAKSATIDTAARSLAYILQLLSQDAVITGLYSLGNMLSNSGADRAAGVSGTNGSLNARRGFQNQADGSALSLEFSGDEEISTIHGNVVHAIVSVASSCKDNKITALALSILLQKLGRIDLAVDVHIIREAARLIIGGGAVELKSLLKLYVRISHDGAVQRNSTMLAAVGVLHS